MLPGPRPRVETAQIFISSIEFEQTLLRVIEEIAFEKDFLAIHDAFEGSTTTVGSSPYDRYSEVTTQLVGSLIGTLRIFLAQIMTVAHRVHSRHSSTTAVVGRAGDPTPIGVYTSSKGSKVVTFVSSVKALNGPATLNLGCPPILGHKIEGEEFVAGGIVKKCKACVRDDDAVFDGFKATHGNQDSIV